MVSQLGRAQAKAKGEPIRFLPELISTFIWKLLWVNREECSVCQASNRPILATRKSQKGRAA